MSKSSLLAIVSEIIDGSRENRTIATTSYADEDNEGDDQDSYIETKSEASDILEVATDCIQSLLRISILIGKATPRDRFSKAFDHQREAFLDQFDINYVAERYPKLSRPESQWLCERLGRANTKRRQFLRYCREHHERLAHDRDGKEVSKNVASLPAERDIGLKVDENTVEESMPNQTVNPFLKATSSEVYTRQSTHASTLDVSRLQTVNEDFDDDEIKSSTTFASMADPESQSILNLPSLADISQGQAVFECPLCHSVKAFKREKAWKQHAYTDLKAYVCTLGKDECDAELFIDSKSWFEHEMTHHRCEWMCIICQQGPFTTPNRLMGHMETRHVGLDVSQISTRATAGQRSMNEIPAKDCPFCDEWEYSLEPTAHKDSELDSPKHNPERIIVVDRHKFRRHVAFHLQQLALFSLPCLVEKDIEDNQFSHISQRSENNSTWWGEEVPPNDLLHRCFCEVLRIRGTEMELENELNSSKSVSSYHRRNMMTLLHKCSSLLCSLANYASVHFPRSPFIRYHLDTILPCLSADLEDMNGVMENQKQMKGMIIEDKLSDLIGNNLVGHFNTYNEFLVHLQNSSTR